MVEVTLFERPDGTLLLHLVNASGHFGVREVAPVPMRDAEVVLPIEGSRPRSGRWSGSGASSRRPMDDSRSGYPSSGCSRRS